VLALYELTQNVELRRWHRRERISSPH